MTDTTQPPAETLARAPLPCPFCGEKAHIEDGRNDRPWVIQCVNSECPAQPFMDHADTRREAVTAWNTRAALTRRAGGDAIPAGMRPWHGGDAAPADWDGGPVLRRHGGLSMPDGQRAWASNGGGLGNVIAYTTKAPAKPEYEVAWREMHDALSWMQGNRHLHAYWGWNFAAIANDLIARAYPDLRAASAGPGDRPSDEDLDPYLPARVQAEKRLGVQRSVWLTGWFVPWSPRNCNENAEGPWSHWVALAHAIIEADNAARAKLAADEEVSA